MTGVANDFTVTKAEMTLTDAETAPGTMTLTTAPASVSEGASATQVTVTATLGGSVTLAGATEVTVSVGGGSSHLGHRLHGGSGELHAHHRCDRVHRHRDVHADPEAGQRLRGDETIDVTGVANDFTVTKAEMTLTDDETAPGTITLTTAPASVGRAPRRPRSR